MSGLKVCKFGGSSITNREDVSNIARILSDDTSRRIVVLSAPGIPIQNEGKSYRKVTDMLIALAKSPDPALVGEIMERYQNIASKSSVQELESIINKRLRSGDEAPSYLDSIKAFGEEAIARLAALELGATYIDPKEIFRVSNNYGNARILPESEKMVIERLSGTNEVYIVPGFFGYTKDGMIATFSRGGSDLTGAFIAAALKADVYENYKDTDGVFAANPKIVKNPRKIDAITYDELRDLAYSGFTVFHDEAVQPVKNRRIPVHVRNTFSYPQEGTFVLNDRLSDSKRPIVGVAYQSGFCSIDVKVTGLNKSRGTFRDIADIFANEGISIEYPTAGIDELSFIFEEKSLQGPTAVGRITNKIYKSLEGNEDVHMETAEILFHEHMGSLVVAGKGLRGDIGIAADVLSTLKKAYVPPSYVVMGPSQASIIIGINTNDSNRAVNAIYDAFLK
jgi:aspartate kinase